MNEPNDPELPPASATAPEDQATEASSDAPVPCTQAVCDATIAAFLAVGFEVAK